AGDHPGPQPRRVEHRLIPASLLIQRIRIIKVPTERIVAVTEPAMRHDAPLRQTGPTTTPTSRSRAPPPTSGGQAQGSQDRVALARLARHHPRRRPTARGLLGCGRPARPTRPAEDRFLSTGR